MKPGHVTAPLPPFLYDPLGFITGCHMITPRPEGNWLVARTRRALRLVQGGGRSLVELSRRPALEIILFESLRRRAVAYCRRGIKVTNTPDADRRRRRRRVIHPMTGRLRAAQPLSQRRMRPSGA
jgi:hypothetical protein